MGRSHPPGEPLGHGLRCHRRQALRNELREPRGSRSRVVRRDLEVEHPARLGVEALARVLLLRLNRQKIVQRAHLSLPQTIKATTLKAQTIATTIRIRPAIMLTLTWAAFP